MNFVTVRLIRVHFMITTNLVGWIHTNKNILKLKEWSLLSLHGKSLSVPNITLNHWRIEGVWVCVWRSGFRTFLPRRISKKKILVTDLEVFFRGKTVNYCEFNYYLPCHHAQYSFVLDLRGWVFKATLLVTCNSAIFIPPISNSCICPCTS